MGCSRLRVEVEKRGAPVALACVAAPTGLH